MLRCRGWGGGRGPRDPCRGGLSDLEGPGLEHLGGGFKGPQGKGVAAAEDWAKRIRPWGYT